MFHKFTQEMFTRLSLVDRQETVPRLAGAVHASLRYTQKIGDAVESGKGIKRATE